MSCPQLATLALLLGLNFASALDPDDIPFLVQWRSKREGRRGTSICTGSLIAPSWVLTAKHCAVGLLEDRKVTVTINFFDSREVKVKSENPLKLDMRFDAKTVNVVEAQAPKSRGLDIALVKLEEAVGSVPLATLDAVAYGKREHTDVFPVGASGGLHWTGPKQASGTKHHDKLYVDNTGSSSGMRGGDSGGPWLRKMGQQFVVSGVISGGVTRGNGNGRMRLGKAYQPSFVRDWIDEVTLQAAVWSDNGTWPLKEFAEVGAIAAPRPSSTAPLVAVLGLTVIGLSVAMAQRSRAPSAAMEEEESPILE